MSYQQTEVEELWMRMQQFLVHSFLYYDLDENIISDHVYDRVCVRLVELLKKYPEEAKQMPYYEVVGGGGDKSGSGFYIRDYPPQIVTKAYRMLWYHKRQMSVTYNENFADFVESHGRKLEGWTKIDGEWKYTAEKSKAKKVKSPKKG